MHARLRFVFLLGIALGLTVASTEAMAGPGDRPPSELALFLRLNGVRQRYTLADGGASGLYGTTASCMPVSAKDVLVINCSAAAYICDSSTDAGCSTTATDINYGAPLAASTDRYIVVDPDTSSTLCMVASSTANCPVWRMR